MFDSETKGSFMKCTASKVSLSFPSGNIPFFFQEPLIFSGLPKCLGQPELGYLVKLYISVTNLHLAAL